MSSSLLIVDTDILIDYSHGSEKAKNDGYKILGTKYNHPIYCSHTVRRGDFNNLDFTVYDGYNISIDDDTLQELKTMGLINE